MGNQSSFASGYDDSLCKLLLDFYQWQLVMVPVPKCNVLLATVVIGGLMIATFLTLFVLPILYILFERVKVKAKTNST